MSTFETVLACFLIPIFYVLIYIAGKYDILSTLCYMLKEKADEYANKEKMKNADCSYEDWLRFIEEEKKDV